MSPAITVIGCDGGPISAAAAAALAAARCVAGSTRHLASVALPDGVERIRIGSLEVPPQAGSAGQAGMAGPSFPASHPRGAGGTAPPGTATSPDSAIAQRRTGLQEGARDWVGTVTDGDGAPGSGAASGGAASGGAASAFDAALSAIVSHPGPVAVLASGDPGFFGIVRALVGRGAAPDVIPATSSVALAFGRLGLPWDDALVLSAHGRDARPVLAAALGCGKAAILTAPGPTAGPQRFIPALLAAGRPVYVAECLGAPDERLTRVTAGSMREFADPNLVIALDTPGHGGAYGAALASGSIGAGDGSGEGYGAGDGSGEARSGEATTTVHATGAAKATVQAPDVAKATTTVHATGAAAHRTGAVCRAGPRRPPQPAAGAGWPVIWGRPTAGPSQRRPLPTVTQ